MISHEFEIHIFIMNIYIYIYSPLNFEIKNEKRRSIENIFPMQTCFRVHHTQFAEDKNLNKH